MDAEQNTPTGPSYQPRQVPPLVLLFLAGLVVGALLIAAMSKGDVDKAIWFCAGIAISGIASACQAHAARMQASEEREFRKMEAIRAYTLAVRMKAYEDFLSAVIHVQNDITSAKLYDVTNLFVVVRIVGDKSVTSACKEILEILAEIAGNHGTDDDKKKQYSGRYGVAVNKVSHAMRVDLGTDEVEVRQAK